MVGDSPLHKASHSKLQTGRGMWLKLSLPILICITAFMLYPFFYSIILSLYTHKGLNATFVKALGNNFLFLIIQVPIMLILGLFFAYILQTDNLKFKGFFRMAIFLPCVTSLVAYSLVFRTMFQVDGLVNRILMNLHIVSAPLPWLNERGWARTLVIIALCWRWTGYNTMYYIAGLQNIPRDIMEAARIDGCNSVQAFFKVIVPQLKQVIVFTSVTSTIGTLQLFDEITTLTKGGPGNSTLTASYYIFKQSFELNNNYGYSAAMSWVIVLIIAVLSVFQLKATKED